MKLKLPYGDSAGNNQLILPVGYLTADLEKKAIRIHDGITPGGKEILAKQEFILTGENWGSIDTGNTFIFRRAAFGNGRWLILRSQSGGQIRGISHSEDLVNWTHTDFFSSQIMTSLAFGAGLFVAVGSGGHTITSPLTGGVFTWTQRTNTTFSLNSVRFLNELFVATGGNTCAAVSANGTSWSLVSNTSNTGIDVAYGNGVYLIVNNQRQIRRSTNGTTWSNGTTIPGGTTPTGIAFGNGLFVVTFANGVIYTSPDGTTWTARTPNPATTPSVIPLNGIDFGYGLFVAVGNGGFIMTSPDGITWTQRTSNVTTDLHSVRMANNQCMVVGTGGTLLTALD